MSSPKDGKAGLAIDVQDRKVVRNMTFSEMVRPSPSITTPAWWST
jgi:hypothetical protein